MKRRNFFYVIIALGIFFKTDVSFCQFTIDDPYDKKKKTTTDTTDLSRLPKDKLAIGFAYGERLAPPQKFLRGLTNLQEAMIKYAKLEVSTGTRVILGSDKIFDYPVLFFSTENNFDLSENEKTFLKKYLSEGGFVILDGYPINESEGTKGSASLRQMIIDTMGSSARFVRLPNNHDIYSNVNAFEDGPPVGGETLKTVDSSGSRAVTSLSDTLTFAGITPVSEIKNYLEGIYVGNKLVGIFSQKGYFVRWSADSDNEPQLKMGVNMIVYGLSQSK